MHPSITPVGIQGRKQWLYLWPYYSQLNSHKSDEWFAIHNEASLHLNSTGFKLRFVVIVRTISTMIEVKVQYIF